MTRYIEWGTVSNLPGGLHRETLQKVDPTDLSTVQALWSALPPDLRLALAKTAPRVAGRWKGDGVIAWREVNGEPYAIAGRTRVDGYFRIGSAPMQDVQATALDLIQSACDAALIAQGYVLDNGSDDERK